MKKVLLIVLLFLNVFSIVSYKPDNAIAKVSSPYVEVFPNVIGQRADYSIKFVVNSELSQGDEIIVIFPQGTSIPCSSCNPYISSNFLSVNGIVGLKPGIGSTSERKVTIYSPIFIPAGSEVEVFISRSARISNPSIEGEYTLQVSTKSEPEFVTSQPYEIGKSQPTQPKVILSNNLTSRISSYTLNFRSDPINWLFQDYDTITVEFPEGTKLPQVIKRESIIINEKPVKNAIVPLGTSVTIPVPTNISPGEEINLIFTNDVGIINPTEPGAKKLFLSSSIDPSIKVESLPYELVSIEGSKTQFIIEPVSPDGKDGWYITQPLINFIPRLPDDTTAAVYYKIDQGDYTVFTNPFKVPDGIHTVYYYTVNVALNETEDVQSEKIKVDTMAPELQITEPQDNAKIAQNECAIKGTVSDISKTRLLINGKEVSVIDSSFEAKVNLQSGLNVVNLICIDEAGNQLSKDLHITVSSVVPKISISSPINMSEICGDYINVKGTVDVPSIVAINGESIPVNNDGSFVYTILLNHVPQGFFLVNIVATSNESGLSSSTNIMVIYNPKPMTVIIKLTVGFVQAYVGENLHKLDSPPYIDKNTNRTLVPLRFIAEAFGAQVNWDNFAHTVTIKLNSKEIKLQIGNNQAVVDGKSVTLDQPPVIVNGRTFVPIRFISETFGADVQWDAATKTVTIVYKLQ